MPNIRRLLPVAFALLCALAGPTRAQQGGPPAAAGATQAPPAIAAKTLEDLVATIEDPARRQQLLDQLRALLALQQRKPAQPSQAESLMQELSAFFTSLSDEISQTAIALVDQVARLPQQTAAFYERLQDPEQRGAIVTDAIRLGAILLAGLLAALLVWFATRRLRARVSRGRAAGPIRKLLRAVLRLLIELVVPASLMAVAFVGFAVITTTPSGTALVLAITSAIAARWIAKALLGFLFAPQAPDIRTLPLGDEMAMRLTRSLDRLLALGIYGFFALQAVAAIGAGPELLAPLRSLYGLLLLFTCSYTVVKYRAAGRGETAETGAAGEVAAVVSGPSVEPPPSRWSSGLRSVLGLWWIVAIVYLVGLYTVYMSGIEGGFAFALRATALTAVTLVGLVLAVFFARKLLAALGIKAQSALVRVPILARRAPRYVDTLRLIVDIAAVLLAAGLILDAWGIAAMDALASPQIRGALMVLLNVVLIVLIATALIDVATAFTQSYLTRTEREGRASGKVKTLIPLAQKTIKFVVVVLAGITVLSQIGMDIAPILAGVGVLGLAVGFGAQTLVKDIITGAFMLIEDSVAVGDIVTIGDVGGVVEAISIRTIRLRDLHGAVHTVPFSSVTTVTNLTKDFSRYLIECGVAYREDVDEVIAVLQEVGAGMKKDPVFGPDLTEPIEILGLDRFEDSAVIVRARLITKPGRQWALGREFNKRLKRVFDERGIEIPFPHRTLYIGEDKQGKSPPLFVQQLEADGDATPA